MTDPVLSQAIAKALARSTPGQTDIAIALFVYDLGAFDHVEVEDMARLVREARSPVARPSAPPQRATQPPRKRAEPAQSFPQFHRASYRFVPLNDRIVPSAAPDLDLPTQDGLCATLEVEWRIDTPILVGDETNGVSEPLKIGETWALPGSTLRGLIRSVVETAAFSRLGRGNQHELYSFRDFNREDYGAATVTAKIRAGWLRPEGEGWVIAPTADQGRGWGLIEVAHLAASGIAQIHGDSEIALRRRWAGLSRAEKAARLSAMATPLGQRWIRVVREPSQTGAARYRPSPNGQEAALVVTGKQPDQREDRLVRRYEYVFAPPPEMTWTPVETEAWKLFELANCRAGRKGPVPAGAWAELEPLARKQGQWIPVFWTGELSRQAEGFSLGLTRLFKVPHRYGVAEVARRSHPRHGSVEMTEGGPVIDFAEGLFGHVFEDDDLDRPGQPAARGLARRGRVSFEPAWAGIDDFRRSDREIRTTTMAPRPSFAPFYLVGEDRDWSSGSARLAGRKRYLPRYPDPQGRAARDIQQRLAQHPPNRVEQASRLRLLEPCRPGESAFRGRIRLHNVDPVEAGAIVWALTFGGRDSLRHMIGRARSFGAGQARAVIVGVTGAWNRGGVLSREDCPTWMEQFETAMEAAAPGWRNSDTLTSLLASADPVLGADLEASGLLTPLRLREADAGKQVNPFQKLRNERGGDQRRLLTLKSPRRRAP